MKRENISSLQADSQNLRGNPQDLRALRSNHPPIEKIQDSQGGLPRSHSLARNDEFIRGSSLCKCSAQNDNFRKFAESAWRFAFSSLGGLESIRWIGFFFWQKPKEAKTFNKDF